MGSKTLAGLTLLVVEDNEILREGLAAVLRREGCAVALAADGEEALAYLRAKPPPDLVLLDMMMPRVDGWEFLVERRRNPALAAVPVVITTALSIANAEWATSLGAAGLLRKPVETEALIREVRRCRRRE
jgi:two-component system response regulator MprA